MGCEEEEPELFEFGEDCESNEECVSDICARGRCTVECDDSTPCTDGSGCTENVCDLLQRPIEQLNVGMLYTGVIGDYGWTKMHDESRIYLQEQFPDATIEYSLSVDSDNVNDEISNYASNDANVIIGTGMQLMDAFVTQSPNYPDINFLLCVPSLSGPNLGAYYGRIFQGLHLAGMSAGYATTNNRIGIIGAAIVPPPVRYINAFTLGARAANPDAQVFVSWSGSWADVELDGQSTEALLGEDIDVIMTTTNNIVHFESTKDLTTQDGLPIYSIVRATPSVCEGEDRCLTTVYFNWGPFVTEILNDMVAGTWETHGNYWRGFSEEADASVVALAPFNEAVIDSDARGAIESRRLELAENPVLPFVGPLNDSNGNSRLEAGESLTETQLNSMCWFVEGVFDVGGTPGEVPADCTGDR